MRRTTEVETLADATAVLAVTGARPGDVLEGVGDNSVAIVRPDGTPLRLDNSVTQVETLTSTVSVGAGPRTITYTVTGLRPGQRASLSVAWGNRLGGSTFVPALGAGAPAGAAIAGFPVTSAQGQTHFITGAASSLGVATVPVTFTASAPDTCDVIGSVNGVGVDIFDLQTVAFT